MDSRIIRSLGDLQRNGLLVDIGGDWNKVPADCSLKCDSRTVGPGDIFACVKGAHSDGHDFIDDVLAKGAGCLLAQRPMRNLPIPWIQVSDVRAAMGYVAASLYGEPALNLKMIGVTGTQGKSTTSYMIRGILERSGIKCGLLGTIVYDDGERVVLADRTTPESAQVQGFLRDMVKNGCKACSMECSSHGIYQGRLSGCQFDGAVFTNLTPEHLDYHGTMEDYFKAKEKLFKTLLKPNGVVACNAASEYGRRLEREFPGCLSWGLNVPARLRGSNAELRSDGCSFDMSFDGHVLGRVNIPIPGLYNIENALGAAAVCIGCGVDEKAVLKGLEDMPQVPGRMERLSISNGTTVIIDYAHTADSLRSLLKTLRPIASGRLISLFGHGGERFSGHRPLLGKAAAEFADMIFVTMDNPRGEDPERIARQIVEGIKEIRDSGWAIVMPRGAAIEEALEWCVPGDTLVLSGKGPEPYLEIQGVKVPYSDRGVVEAWAARKGYVIK